MNDSFQQGLQLKGEIMDLEFTLDTDHRSVARRRGVNLPITSKFILR